jgi:uncharacterized membrane protein YqjE
MSLLGSEPPRARLPSLGEGFGLLAEALEHRTELAALEVDEARGEARVFLALGVVVAQLTLLTGVAVTLTVAGLVWDGPHRVGWLAGLAGLYLLGAVVAGVSLWRRWRAWRPLKEISGQLSEDRQCLNQLIRSIIS